MEIKEFSNFKGVLTYYILWDIPNPKGVLVISHGMAEHPERYDDLANFLNKNGYVVAAIYQIGHGKFAKIPGHMDKGDFDICVSNLNELTELLKKQYQIPTFLLGHSMGSFIAQLYAERYGNSIKGLILSGSTKAVGAMKMGAMASSLNCFFAKDLTVRSNFMNKMSFGSYNSKYKEVKTDYDWLTRDEAIVKQYIDDPLCGYVCTKGFFYNLTHGIATMGKKKEIQKVPKDLPILIHGGSMDPVSAWGKGLYALKKQYDDLGMKDVSLFVYDGARHEIYNEINKEEVYNNTLNFLNAHI